MVYLLNPINSMVIVHGELSNIARWYKQHGVIFRNIPPGVSQDHRRDPEGSGDGEWLFLATGHSAGKWFQFNMQFLAKHAGISLKS